jgi:hypothetical protein
MERVRGRLLEQDRQPALCDRLTYYVSLDHCLIDAGLNSRYV